MQLSRRSFSPTPSVRRCTPDSPLSPSTSKRSDAATMMQHTPLPTHSQAISPFLQAWLTERLTIRHEKISLQMKKPKVTSLKQEPSPQKTTLAQHPRRCKNDRFAITSPSSCKGSRGEEGILQREKGGTSEKPPAGALDSSNAKLERRSRERTD